MREEIENALTVLKRGGVILYPTDTVWGIGCDATNAEAIDKVYKIKYAVKPTTVIYDDPIRVAENLIAEDNSLGIRVVQDDFCKTLIRKLKRPLVSTSANISGEKTPATFKEISPLILEGVDYVVNLYRNSKPAKPSSIIKLKNNGAVTIIRE